MSERVYLSKSRYCEFRQCPRAAWLRLHRPEILKESEDALARMRTGNEVGDLARGLFGPYVNVTVRTEDALDLAAMVEETRREMEKGTPVICEASFSHDGLYCAVDLLRREDTGWAVYEVKSSTSPDSPRYLDDVSYQRYVLEKCGVKVTGVYLVCLESTYVYDGSLDIHRLFRITDMTEAAAAKAREVEEQILLAREILSSDVEPEIDLSEACLKDGGCPCWGHCAEHVCSPSVFDLYRLAGKKKMQYYHDGLSSFAALRKAGVKLNEKQDRQIAYALEDMGDHTEPEKIRGFLEGLRYPLYFLDFETFAPAVPRFFGTKPYTQVPFQYSLHVIRAEGEEPEHLEFLAEPEGDPRRALAERLCRDIPMGACVTAYNKSFECGRIGELAELYPDLREHLLDIQGNISDLLIPFQSGWYYNRAMGGSFSIKSVLPALYPNDPDLDYHNLEDVHHGGEASEAFAGMAEMEPEERARIRKNLLRYCGLDTYAMVKVWEKLREAAC